MKWILSCCMLLATAASAQLGNYDAGGPVPVVSVRHRLVIDTAGARLHGGEQLAGVLGGIIPPLLDLGSTLIQTSLKSAAARYESQFTVSASASGFWVSEKQVMLPSLVITRDVLLKKDPSGGLQEAMRIRLEPELSQDRTAFRFVLATPFTYRYSAAKTRRAYDYINLDLLISLSSLAVTEGQYKLVGLRSTVVSIPAIRPGDSPQQPGSLICSGWIPFPPPPSFEVLTESAKEETRIVSTRGTNNGKPDNDTLTTHTRIVRRDEPVVRRIYQNAGLYEFEVVVHESNPYKAKAAIRNELVSRSADPAADVFKAAVKE